MARWKSMSLRENSSCGTSADIQNGGKLVCVGFGVSSISNLRFEQMSTVTEPDTAGVFSCVVDDDPRFHFDALRWFATLTGVAGVSSSDLVVNCVGSQSSRALEYLRLAGVGVREIRRFDASSVHCNKIAGALALTAEADDVVVLTDTDVVVLEDVRQIGVPPRTVGFKTVDGPNPPLDVLRRVFDDASIPYPPAVSFDWWFDNPGEETFETNANGGLYVLRGDLLNELAPQWADWARWLLRRRGILSSWEAHVDQVAMALTLASMQVDPLLLGVRWNFPSHVLEWIPNEVPTPAVIHYHRHVADSGMLGYVGVPAVDEAIGRANKAIGAVWSDVFAGKRAKHGVARFVRAGRLLIRRSRRAGSSRSRPPKYET